MELRNKIDLFVGYRGWMYKEVISNGEIKEFRSNITGNVYIYRSFYKEIFGY